MTRRDRGDMSTPNPSTVFPAVPAFTRGSILSITVHATLLLALFGVAHTSLNLAPYKLPGTAQGTRLITFYSPGSPAHAVSELPTKSPAPHPAATPTHATLTSPTPQPTGAPAADVGTGSSPQNGLGEGDIRIALQTHYPHPNPDLSALAHGSRGDVVLNAVIDEHGNITDLTLLRGLGPAIDNAVIAVVKQWSYTPATRNGVPVPSEQELRFHYERS